MPWLENKEYSTNKWEVIPFTEDRTAYIYGEHTHGWAELYFSQYELSAYQFNKVKEDIPKLAINGEQKKYLQLLINRALPGYL